MVLKPGVHGVVFALPGMLLSAWFFLISIAGYATGMPLGVAAGVFGIGLAFSVTWLPVILYLATARLSVDADTVEMRSWFGLRVRRIGRREIAGVAVSSVEVSADDRSAGAPVSYYDITRSGGRRWARLRTWIWKRSDCDRLREELRHPGAVVWMTSEAPTPGRLQPATAATVSPDEGFRNALQSAGCAVQGFSMLFGFGLATVIGAAAFNLPMGRQLGLVALPGALIGAAIGSSALTSRRIYSFLITDVKTGALRARVVALTAVVAIPVVIWVAALYLFFAGIQILARSLGQ